MTDPGAESPASPASVIDELVSANMKSTATMHALVAEVRHETAARDRKIAVLEKNNRQTMYLIVMVGVVAVLLLGLAIVNAVNINQARVQSNQIASINGTLLDCVNSTGECGRANATSQQRLLDSVKQYELTGFYCIRNNPAVKDPDGEAFLKCMERLYPGGPKLNSR